MASNTAPTDLPLKIVVRDDNDRGFLPYQTAELRPFSVQYMPGDGDEKSCFEIVVTQSQWAEFLKNLGTYKKDTQSTHLSLPEVSMTVLLRGQVHGITTKFRPGAMSIEGSFAAPTSVSMSVTEDVLPRLLRELTPTPPLKKVEKLVNEGGWEGLRYWIDVLTETDGDPRLIRGLAMCLERRRTPTYWQEAKAYYGYHWCDELWWQYQWPTPILPVDFEPQGSAWDPEVPAVPLKPIEVIECNPFEPLSQNHQMRSPAAMPHVVALLLAREKDIQAFKEVGHPGRTMRMIEQMPYYRTIVDAYTAAALAWTTAMEAEEEATRKKK